MEVEKNFLWTQFPDEIVENHEDELIDILKKDIELAQDSVKMITSFDREVTDYLRSRDWIIQNCDNCFKEFFSKNNSSTFCPNCRASDEFISFEGRKRLIDDEILADNFRSFFSSLKYIGQNSIPMIPKFGQTLFTIAGVQIINPHLFADEPLINEQTFILQPSIRLQTMDDTKSYCGCSTAFVNSVTIQPVSIISDHLVHFDHWLDFLTDLGFQKKYLGVKFRYGAQNWGLGNFINMNIDVYYGGLSLFNASFFYKMPTVSKVPINVSDMGITIERTLWMLNKTSSYFDIIGPYEMALSGKNNEIDAIRTMVLMMGSGVIGNSKSGKERMRSKKIRCFARKISRLNGQINVGRAVDYFYDYWNKYIDFPVQKFDVVRAIQKEHQIAVNQEILEILGSSKMSQNIELDTHIFIKKLIDERIATREQIEKIFIY
ncbi:MAG: hypothetical protein RBS56_02180 [Candidatus Gracilibacteria bacterium]|nr:hypothetical protein [Candidatus Gracilibacteria bacterium]